MDYVALSKEVSYALRHAPWEYGLELDDEGFVSVDQLLASLNEASSCERPVTANDLMRIIRTSDKRRHEIVNGKIRALYGHTIPLKIVKAAATPPASLYHGTARKFLNAVLEEGLKPMARQYVHLSVDVDTARHVGLRHDPKPIILLIDAELAAEEGQRFYIGNDKVWLADEVPAKYLNALA